MSLINILIKGNYGTCDSCGKTELINVIYAGDIGGISETVEMDLCDNCLGTLHDIAKPEDED